MTKIFQVISRLNIGGISPYVIPITSQLREAGFKSELIAGSVGKGEGDMSYLAQRVQVQPIPLASLGREINPLRDLSTIRDLYQLFRREKPDIVHTHTAKAGFAGRIAARLAGVPLIYHTYHGHVFSGYWGPAKTRFYRALEQFCGAVSTKILTVSPNLRRELAEVYQIAPPRKVDIVVPGYDLSALYALQRPYGDFRGQFFISAEAPIIGIVGRLVPIKNHALLLRAMPTVSAALPNVKLVIIGDGELRPEIEALVESLGVREQVIFTGWQNDLPPIFAALDVLALTSKNEGLPSAVIEALVTGVPVVATAVGGVVDMLADGRGALLSSDNPLELANALINALTDPSAKVRAAAQRKDAFDLYHIQPSAERLIAFYRKELGS